MIKLNIAPFHAGIGDTMLHDLLRRPVTLIRCSTGRMEKCFYQRHGFSGLLQFAAVEFHPLECRIEDLEQSDRMTPDLDPGEAVDWPTLAAAA